MSWDNEKTVSFIKEYEKRPILWDKSHKLYYNILKKEEAWRQISEVFDEDISVLKKKIESLRGSRRREKNRMLRSIKTRKGRTGIYISRWFAWDALTFLDDTEAILTTISNYSSEEEEEEVTAEDIEDVKPEVAADNLSPNSDPYNQYRDRNNTFKEPGKPQENIFSSPMSLAPKRKRKESERQNAFNTSQSTVEMERKRDECSVFGEFIAEKLRKHDDRTRTVLQQQIHNLLYEAEMKMFS